AAGFELGLVADALRLQAIGGRAARDHGGAGVPGAGAEMLNRFGAHQAAGLHDRAAELARPPAILGARLEHIAAEAPDRLLGRDAQQPLGLRIEVADRAVLVDRIHALDDAAEHRTRLGLAPPQRAREL